MKKFFSIIILCIVLITFSVSLITYIFPKNKTVSIPSDAELLSVVDIYEHIEQYIKENIGDEYALYQINAKYNREFMGEFEFIYTKRTKIFRDAYFITLDTKNRKIEVVRQNEAKRMHGREDIYLVPTQWNLSEKDISEIGSHIDYDFIEWSSRYSNSIAVKYLKNDRVVYNVDVNVNTKEILGSW